MRYGIQTKVTGFLVLVLALVFGGSTLFGVRRTSSIMHEQGQHAQVALRQGAYDQARKVFAGLETGTRGSLERGEMGVFEDLLSDLSKIEGVLEIGLADPEGKVVYSSDPTRLGQQVQEDSIAAAVSSEGEVHTAELGDTVSILRAHTMEPDCLRCHFDAEAGATAGVLYASYSLDGLRATEREQADLLQKAQRESAVSGLITGLVGLVAASVGVFLLLRVLVCRKLDRLTEQSRELATGDADLTVRLPANSQDEMGEVARAFNAFVENLQQLIAEVLETSAEVVAGSKEIGDASVTLLGKAGEQSDQARSVATAAEQMSSTVLEVARSSQDASAAAKAAADTAESGGQVVGDGVAGMLRVAERVRTIAAKVEILGESSRSIGEVMGVIDDIADQTNLLALNAAIEAARAGEHGRGFAVVADEVRKLSEKTAHATRQVRDTVAAIQAETEEAVSLVTEGLAEVERTSEMSKRAGDALREIVAKIDTNADMVSQIATSTEQQSATVAEISGSVDSIAVLAGEVSAGVDEVSSTARNLGEKTGRLHQLVSRFKV